MRRLNDIEHRLRVQESKTSGPLPDELYSSLFTYPGLRSLWLAGVTYSDGAVLDLTRTGMDLTRNGGPLQFLDTRGFAYQSMDGDGDYFSHADTDAIEVSGAEAFISDASKGLTLGGWFRFPAAFTAFDGLIGKYLGTGNQREYALYAQDTAAISCAVSSDGTAAGAAGVTSAAVARNVWAFVWGRFDPSTSLTIAVNNILVTNTTSIPASIFGGTAAFEVGRLNAAGTEPQMDWAMAFLAAAYWSDSLLTYYWNRSRAIMGV